MNRILKLYLSTLVGILAYCLAYMISTIFAVVFIGYDKILKNPEGAILSFKLIGIAVFILIFIFVYKLINKIRL